MLQFEGNTHLKLITSSVTDISRDLDLIIYRLNEEMGQMREKLDGLSEEFIQAIREEMD
jgi:hypothetical protein